MIEGGIRLGHLMIAMAMVELLAIPLLARSVRRANPDSEEAQRGAVRIVIFAAIVCAAGLCLAGLFLPIAQLRIL